MNILRKVFIGGNWKCNNSLEKTSKLVQDVLNNLVFDENKVEVVVAPVSLQIPYVTKEIISKVKVSAQNISLTNMGAYTGEIAAEHLKDFGVNWVILGHSERRSYYNENDAVVAGKVLNALNNGLNVIACIGEKENERDDGTTFSVLERQLSAINEKVTLVNWSKIVLAYEPVWAIGTGKNATPAQAQEVHEFIRNYLQTKISDGVAQQTRIIYGGSVTEKNSAELITQKDIDGFLIGGASLKPEFAKIVKDCNELK